MAVARTRQRRCRLFVALAFASVLASVMAVSPPTPDVVSEIRRVLQDREDLSYVVKYLEKSHDRLAADLPVFQPDGEGNRYTFFAPKNWGFVRVMPQDAVDPFYVDDDFRHTVLLRHFARKEMSPTDFIGANELVMADLKPATFGHTATGGNLINGAAMEPAPIPLPFDLGIVYIVDRVFTTHQEVSAVLKEHPATHTPWGAIHPPGHQSAVESETVVVDLLAELLG